MIRRYEIAVDAPRSRAIGKLNDDANAVNASFANFTLAKNVDRSFGNETIVEFDAPDDDVARYVAAYDAGDAIFPVA